MSWWNRYPGALQQEIDELAAAGMHPQLNESVIKESGKVTIHIRLRILGAERNATILYPDLYPYFRPILLAQELDYNLRHYNPFAGEICLLRRGTRHWLPSMTAAFLIEEMRPEWENAAVRQYEDSRLDTEDHQAEPISVYFDTARQQLVMIDTSWELPPEVQSGHIKIAISEDMRSISPSSAFSAWAMEIMTHEKIVIEGAKASENIQAWTTSRRHKTVNIRWTRLDSSPRARTIQELIDTLPQVYPQVHKEISRDIASCKNGLHGLCFPEEAPGGGKRAGWLFIAYKIERIPRQKKRPPMLKPLFWLVKSEAAGEKDLFERIPELAPLRTKKVVIVGLGCVGAPSVLALARAGIGELRLLDGDYVSPGTTCRWPIGLTAAGGGKVKELSQFIQNNYPFTKIRTSHYPPDSNGECRIKLGQIENGYDQMDVLERLIDGADLIYDATAEEGINQMLSDLARAYQIPYITVAARAGGWGGNVVRIRSDGSSGCFLCYLHALEDGSLPQPPYDPNGDELQPVGCGDLTFKAAGFDVEEISLAGVRMAVSTLSEGFDKQYPQLSNDVGILTLRKNEEAIFPYWQTFPLQKHSKCKMCQ